MRVERGHLRGDPDLQVGCCRSAGQHNAGGRQSQPLAEFAYPPPFLRPLAALRRVFLRLASDGKLHSSHCIMVWPLSVADWPITAAPPDLASGLTIYPRRLMRGN